MKRLYYIVFFLMYAYSGFSQANVWTDKAICANGGSIEIGDDGDKTSCYSWTSNPTDPNVANLKDPKITVSPTQTTTYTRTTIEQEFSKITTNNVKVNVLNFQDIVVKEQSEPNAFYDKPEVGGSIFMTGTFNFKVNPQVTNPNSITLNWDIYDLDFFDEELAHGTGNDFIHTFTNDNEDGAVRVRFWFDNNGNSELDNDECSVETEFEVKNLSPQIITVAVPTTITSVSTATVDGILSTGNNNFRVKNRIDDYRCSVNFTRNSTSIGSWTPTINLPGAVMKQSDFDNINSNVGARVKVVTQLTWCGPNPPKPGFSFVACTTTGSANTVIVALGASAAVWIHELGHSVGLPHRPCDGCPIPPADVDNLMNFAPINFIINKFECEKFEK